MSHTLLPTSLVVEPARMVIAPDCGLKYLPRDLAFAKMQAMVAGAAIVRGEVRQQASVVSHEAS
jgi:hypothetical protein